MDVIKGVVSQFKSEAIIGKTSRSGTISHSNVATFRVDGKPVTASFSQPMHLADGEQAVVGGRTRGGVLHAVAVKNADTGVVYGNTFRGWYFFPFFIVVFLLITVFNADIAREGTIEQLIMIAAALGIPALLVIKFIRGRATAIDIVRRS